MDQRQIVYKRYSKKYFIYLVLLPLFLIVIYVVFYIIIDPLQIFHKSWFQNDRLNPSMREQAAGIINNFEFDSVILGSSQLENTSAKEASKKIGGNFFNISIAGIGYYERSFVLDKVLRKNIKKVICSADFWSYIFFEKDRESYPVSLYNYLYDRNIFNDFKIYATKKYLKNFSPLFMTHKVNIDRPNAWYNTPDSIALIGGLEKWIEYGNIYTHDFLVNTLAKSSYAAQNKKDKLPEVSREYKQNVAEYLDKYMLNYAKQYKNTQFYLIIPPCFRYIYADWRQNDPETFVKHQYAIRYLVEEAQQLNNVRIFGFEDQDFLDDIANYKDTVHYHYRFNSYFLDAIAQGKHEITTDNLDSYLAKCDKLAYDFDIMKLYNDAQALIRKRNIRKGH